MNNKNYNYYLIEKKKNNWRELINEKKNKGKNAILPPPNITGDLHIGHALNSIILDFFIRSSYLIKNKKKIDFIPGIDHAGISTQSKIESLDLKKLDNNIKKINYTSKIWYPDSKKNFCFQWKKLGLLINTKKIFFTFDKRSQKIVKESFIKLYKEEFIYRGLKLVNWDPKIKSVISDSEIEERNILGNLYYLKYFLEDSKDYLLVATTRPETIFADVSLFVNPNDQRYKKFINKKVFNPLNKKKIPILADEKVKIEFGSGVLKCTPGHDFKDYELAKKHNLPIITCCNEKGLLNERANKWKNKNISYIRKELVEYLLKKNICEKIEEKRINVNYSIRTNSMSEIILSKQWFLNLPLLIKKVNFEKNDFLENIDIKPLNFKNELKKWKNNAKEWCISRQSWWGHKIPAWYQKKSNKTHVGIKKPIKGDWLADKDVLDTWFSSSLWPIITTYKNIKNNSFLYPTTLLITGYDIIFFWVLKMIIMGYFFKKEKPFKKIFIHGLIRDEKGKKMSKSLNNGILPNEIIKKHGCDSLRIFLLENNIWGSDLNYKEEKIKKNWKLCQKIWNIFNFIKIKTNFKKITKKELFSNN